MFIVILLKVESIWECDCLHSALIKSPTLLLHGLPFFFIRSLWGIWESLQFAVVLTLLRCGEHFGKA